MWEGGAGEREAYKNATITPPPPPHDQKNVGHINKEYYETWELNYPPSEPTPLGHSTINKFKLMWIYGRGLGGLEETKYWPTKKKKKIIIVELLKNSHVFDVKDNES